MAGGRRCRSPARLRRTAGHARAGPRAVGAGPRCGPLYGCDRPTVLDAAVAAADDAGEPERGVALATAALAEAEGDPVRTAWLLWQRATMLGGLGRAGLDDLNAAVRIAPPGHPVRAVVLCALANRLLAVSRSDEAEEAAAEALDIARAAGDARTEALALIVLATRRVRRGDLAAELPRLAEAEEAAVRLGAHGVRLQAVFAEAMVLVVFGEYERAAERARHGIAVAESIGLARTYGAVGSSHLANALIGQGRWDEATSAMEHALDHTPAPVLQVPLVCLRATIALARVTRCPRRRRWPSPVRRWPPGSGQRWTHGCPSGWRQSCSLSRAAWPRRPRSLSAAWPTPTCAGPSGSPGRC